jgi:hypothetical protein
VQGTGKRSSRASEIIAKCKTPPPTACATDAECTTFDIDTWDGVCASTLKAGIAASQRATYVASTPCFIPGPAMPPSCVVHWVRAEDGPSQPPPQTVIAAKCINRACVTQYFAPSR